MLDIGRRGIDWKYPVTAKLNCPSTALLQPFIQLYVIGDQKKTVCQYRRLVCPTHNQRHTATTRRLHYIVALRRLLNSYCAWGYSLTGC